MFSVKIKNGSLVSRVEAGYDRIVLSELEPGSSVILSYHYLDTLRSDSGHPIRGHGEPGDPLGLIEIEDVPERLVIRNRGLVGGIFADAFRGASGNFERGSFAR